MHKSAITLNHWIIAYLVRPNTSPFLATSVDKDNFSLLLYKHWQYWKAVFKWKIFKNNLS